MFARESEMATSVSRWMNANGMTAKAEFVTPWGICDFVGVRFNTQKVAHRIKLRQISALTSITRAALLLQIPNVESNKSIGLERLIRDCAPSIPEDVVRRETSRLISDRFVVRSSSERLQKVNGWMPLHDRIVAVESKLSRVDEVTRQAVNNLGFADESYIALPADLARRVVSNTFRRSKLFDAGIGLLSVARHRCDVLLIAEKSRNCTDEAIQLYCVEKFWNNHLKGN
jgi:hypothetical protein